MERVHETEDDCLAGGSMIRSGCLKDNHIIYNTSLHIKTCTARIDDADGGGGRTLCWREFIESIRNSR